MHLAPHTHPGGPESLHHFQGKHLIAEWARTVTDADVEVNEEEWSPDIRRRADVMVTWPDGRQVAFEIEYKRSAAARFREKNDDYRRRGITPVWLFGHTSAYLRPDSRVDRDAALFRLTSVTEQVAAADLPVLFINPSEANVGTLSREQESLADARERSPRWWDRVDAVGERPVTPMDRSVGLRLSVDALNECLLTPEAGLVSPAMKRIDEVRRAVSDAADRDKATEERQAEARRKRASEEAQAYQERKRREAREAPPTPSGVTGPGRCVVCGRVMDPVLSTGRHILC